jgi:dienelactone hydrolase
LFVIMPYYGPRRDPTVPTRMISTDPEETVRGMTQAVKDIRYAAAWLGAQDEVDPQQLGITGISLGGIMAALSGAAEPRFHKICPVLAGGGIAAMVWDSPQPHLIEARKKWLAAGKTRESLVTLMQTVDPATYGDRIRDRKVLMLNAAHDEVIPYAATIALWRAFGKPPITWYGTGHYTAIWHIGEAIASVTEFFQADPPAAK